MGKLGSYSPRYHVKRSHQAAGDVYANIKVSQQRRGLPLDENDLWMAATAVALGAILVSRDSDFQGIEGLSVVAP